MKFALRFPFVTGSDQQADNEDLLAAVNTIGKFILEGTGVPTADPGGPALYFRHDFAVGASVYGWDGSWHHLW